MCSRQFRRLWKEPRSAVKRTLYVTTLSLSVFYKHHSKQLFSYSLSHFCVTVAPVCKPAQKIVYGIALGETARILCDVEANPTDVTFYWTFNNSATATVTMDSRQHSRFVSEGMRSSLSFTPISKSDFGKLACWAKNGVGTQLEPCIFSVIPAG